MVDLLCLIISYITRASVKVVQLTSLFSDQGLVNLFGGSYFLSYTNLSFVHEEFRGFDTI